MAAINFPDNPATQVPINTFSPTSTPLASPNGVAYAWDGTVWNAVGPSAVYVAKGGDTMTGNLTVPSLNGGQLAGFRNILVNGNLSINQRGLDVAAVAIGEYGQDRWKRTAGGMTQIIESGNFIPGATYTLSGTGITTQQIVAPASGNWTLPDVPTAARLIQLELGTVATPFEQRGKGLELMLCQRYYCVVDAVYGFDGNLGATSVGQKSPWSFPVVMRAIPTVQITRDDSLEASGSGVNDIKVNSASLNWDWLNGTTVTGRTKSATITASAEL